MRGTFFTGHLQPLCVALALLQVPTAKLCRSRLGFLPPRVVFPARLRAVNTYKSCTKEP